MNEANDDTDLFCYIPLTSANFRKILFLNSYKIIKK